MHTKGKWTWKQNRGNNYYEHTVFTDHRLGIEIAALSGKGCSPDEVKANARLIAAAPELLAACEDGLRQLAKLLDWAELQVESTWDEEREAIHTLQTAIEAAESEV